MGLRHAAPILIGVVLATAVSAQTAPPPAPVAATPLTPLPGTVSAPPLAAPVAPPPARPAPPAPSGAAATPATPPAAGATPADTWLPRDTAEIQALDKVNARATVLTVPVGKSAAYGSLTITVKACVVRPPDQPQNAAAFLVIADSHADEPGFSGWMVSGAPSVEMLQHPIYDVRVVGCRA